MTNHKHKVKPPEHVEVHICGACGVPLDYQHPSPGFPEGRHYHGVDSADPDAHEAQPIPASQYTGEIKPHCDFCFEWLTGQIQVVESKPFTIEIAQDQYHTMSALWAICGACVECVNHPGPDNWRRLLDRMLKAHDVRNPVKSPGEREGRKHAFRVMLNGVRSGFVEVRPVNGNELQEDAWLGMGANGFPEES